MGTGVEVVAVFEADGADDGFRAQAAADGVEGLIEGIVAEAGGNANGVEESDDGKEAGEGLLQLDVAEEVGFGAEEFTVSVAGGGFAFLVAANGIGAPRGKSAC